MQQDDGLVVEIHVLVVDVLVAHHPSSVESVLVLAVVVHVHVYVYVVESDVVAYVVVDVRKDVHVVEVENAHACLVVAYPYLEVHVEIRILEVHLFLDSQVRYYHLHLV